MLHRLQTPEVGGSGGVPRIVELDLSSTGAMDETLAWTRLFDALQTFASTKFLQRVAVNDEAFVPKASAALLGSIARCTTLTHLSMRGCQLQSSTISVFAAALADAENSSLEYLDVSDNEVSSMGFQALCDALHKNPGSLMSLRILNFGHNCVGRGDKGDGAAVTYCRKGLLSAANFMLHASSVVLMSLADNDLGGAYEGWPAGGDHGGVSEVCEAARRAIIGRHVSRERKPPVVALTCNSFDAKTRDSLHRCSGFTALL
jgi:hypothetical protein